MLTSYVMDVSENAEVDVQARDLSGSDNYDDLKDDEDLLDLHENRLFPSDDHLVLINTIPQLKASNHAAFRLYQCLPPVHNILCNQGQRMRQADLDSVRRFFREDMYYAVDKMLQYPNSIKVATDNQQEGVMEVLQWVACVAADALYYRAHLDPADVVPDLDEDLVPVAQTMLNVFNRHKNLHQLVKDTDVPIVPENFQEHVLDNGYASPFLETDAEGLADGEDPEEPAVERFRWLVALINTFAGLNGFQAIIALLERPSTVSFPFLNMMAAVLAQVIDFLSDEAHELHSQVVGPILSHVKELVEDDHDKLHDYGSDRTYNAFQCLVNVNLPRIIKHSQDKERSYAQLRHIQTTFVLRMLESSIFNKLLSGVKECNKLLKEAADKGCNRAHFQSMVQWIEVNDIVQRILRTNLHQKQYVQEVQGIMVTLTQNQYLTPKHLDLLWGVIEKEDTHEAVKTHMFELLGKLAASFVPSQLDMLFAKLERRQERSVQDTKRLLTLLQQLAESDSDFVMEKKLIQMVWDITIPASAHRDLLDGKPLISVLSAYAHNAKHGEKKVNEYMNRCFQALVKGEGGQVALLRALRDLLRMLPDKHVNKEQTMQELVVDQLIDQGLMTMLVGSLCRKVAAARKAITTAKAEQLDNKAAALAVGIDPDDEAAVAAVTEAAVATLSEGSWSYNEVLRELLLTLRTFASASMVYFEGRLAEKLWDALMVNPPYHEDQLPATQAFFRVGFQGDKPNSLPTFEQSTQQTLLEKHMVLQDASKVVASAVKLFLDIFQKVNLENKVVGWYQTADSDHKQARYLVASKLAGIKGLDFVWSMYLYNPDRKIAQLTKDQILQLYHGYLCAQDSAPYHKALVKRLVSLLRSTAEGLTGKPGQAAEAAQAVSRCLTLALAAVRARESQTMPPVPAHHLAWRGTPLHLDVQQQGVSRLKVTSHTNEYVGLLRQRIARQLGCGAKHVRMLLLGQELRHDSWTLPHEAKNRAVLNAMASPEPNLYTLSPAEYRPYYEEVAFAWLLSQADGLYPLLLRLVDTHHMGDELPDLALELLSTLPTYPALTSQLAAALDGPDKHQQMAAVFQGSNMDGDKKRPDADDKPYQTLYALQALNALLFPTFDESLLPVSPDGDEVMAEASACPSPAAAAGSVTAAASQMQPAAAAVLQQLQKVQHRELQQQEFLQCRGLEVVLAAAQRAARCCKSDLKLQRQLSELLVMMLHNLMDKAHAWNGILGGGGGDAASGAESGACTGAAGALGATGEAAVMSGVQPQSREAGSSSVPGCGTATEPQASAAAGQTTAEQQQPASPSMEDAMSSPPQSGSRKMQQTSKQHRHRTGDLPPLPPAPSTGSNSAGHAAVMAQNLAAVLGSHTLKLVADTLVLVAVQTAQLWGSRSTPLIIDDDDKVANFIAEKDISVVKDALGLLSLLLQHGPLVQQLLLEADQSPLISIVLVNPHYVALRRQAAELLEKLVASEVHPKLLQWLLQQLSAARKIAESVPASSAEFYELLAGTVTRLGLVASSNWGAIPQQLFITARQILDDEVEHLKAVAAAAAPAASSSIQAAAAADILLQGRLQLLLALVRALDRRSVGSDREGGLIRLLLQDFLFPEAVQQLTAAAGRLDLAECAHKLEPRCATPGCRKAALELLSELMGDTTGSLEEGVGLLIDLHHQQPHLTGWNMLPRALRAPGSFMGLKNGGATCYMNAVFQQLFMQPQIRARILAAAEVEQSQAGESVFAQLQAMFATMALGKATFHAPRDFWYAFKDYDGSPIDVKEHQDAYEFFTRLQDFVDQHLSSTGQPPAIKPVMGGTFVQQIICQGVDYTSEREEEFYQISVDVKGMGCLEKSLDDYVKGELMEGDNAYHVEHLGKRVAAVKRTAVKQLPQMLCIHLKRFEFDYHNQTRYKVRDRFEFPLELDMFKYSADGLAAQDQQQKAADQQGKSDGEVSKDGTLSSGDGADSSTLTSSGIIGRQLSDAVQQALAAKNKESVGAGGIAYMYDLKGVVVHSGSAFTGHYYSYIQERAPAADSDGSSEGRWFSFDDKQVTPWDVSYLECECFGGKPSQDGDGRIRPSKNEYDRAHSAYMLFYERRQPGTVGGVQAQSPAAGLSSCQQEPPAAATAVGDIAMTSATAPPAQIDQFVVPYNMPVRLYKQVVESNIQLMWSQHVLDKDYFRFIRQLVDSKGDLGQLSNRKARRRDAVVAPSGPACSGSSGSKLHSSMSCDPQGSTAAVAGSCTPAQLGADGIEGSGAAGTAAVPSPMAISPAPAEAPLPSAAAVNPPRLTPLTIVPPSEPQTSPGPSSRRAEEAETVSVVLLRLGVLFQFQVYLRAADSLRTESSVWTEALMGLMGAGPSSGACLQTFLELAVLHPEWLNQFLVDCDLEVPVQPRRWATELLSWAFETAGKRVSPALSQYICLFVTAQPFVNQGCIPGQSVVLNAAAERHAVAVDQAVNGYLQAMPPLAHAVLAFVDRLVQLVRDCVPLKRIGRDQINLAQEPPDVPADAVRVLQRYAALGPWAAAHLMMVVNIVPDLADIIIATMRLTDDEEYAAEDLLPLYELLYEMLQHASNIPQLAHELCHNNQSSVASHNPYLTTSAQNVSLLGGHSGKLAHAGGSGPLMSAILPQQAYSLLCSEVLFQGMLTRTCVCSPVVVNLAGLLTYNNSAISSFVLKQVNSQLCKCLTMEQKGSDVPRQHWSLVALQPDDFLQPRATFWLLGTFNSQHAPQYPCVLWWTEQCSWPAVHSLMFVNFFLQRLKEQALPGDCLRLRRCILQVLCDQHKLIFSTATVINDGVKDHNLRYVREAVLDLMQQVQQVLQQQSVGVNLQQEVVIAAAGDGAAVTDGDAEVEEPKDVVSDSIDDDQEQQEQE